MPDVHPTAAEDTIHAVEDDEYTEVLLESEEWAVVGLEDATMDLWLVGAPDDVDVVGVMSRLVSMLGAESSVEKALMPIVVPAFRD
jgi:hypothetical protein